MMPARFDKLARLALVVAAAVLLLVLAAGLSTLAFRSEWFGATAPGGGGGPDAVPGWDWVRGFAVAGAISLGLLFIVSLILAPMNRNMLPRRRSALLSLLLFVLVLAIMRPETLRALTALRPPPSVTEQATPPAASSVAPPPFAEPLAFVASLAAAVVLVWLGLQVWKAMRLRPQSPPVPVPRQVAEAAQAALQALHEGAPLTNVIVRCYRDMNRLVAERHAVVREAGVTPREFVAAMRRAGVPGRPVEQLTTLFERTRYGARPLGAPEEADAVRCLQALAAALEPGREH
jgi:hypothetical protein